MSGPLPPADFGRRHPNVAEVPAGTIFHRFHTATFDPVFIDTSRSGRLNAPDANYGVLYAAATRRGAFAETFLRMPGRTLLAPDFVAGKAYAGLKTTRALRLLQLHGNGLARIGATAEVTHGGLPYDVPQAWSAAIHEHPGAFDGVDYTARHDDGEICHALFGRAAGAIEAVERIADLRTGWFLDLLDHYGVGLAPE
ncbi:MAG: hypothetical protein CMP81_14260 [Fulvimarina sp.]|nr:hypothetical protein [Fulvimarina sp.]